MKWWSICSCSWWSNLAERWNVENYSKDNTFNAVDKGLLPNCAETYTVLIILCFKTNAHSQHTSLTTNKENNIHSSTSLQAASKTQQFYTCCCYLHISPSCKSPSSSGQDELQGLCGVRRNAVDPRSCANIISPESSSTCTTIKLELHCY